MEKQESQSILLNVDTRLPDALTIYENNSPYTSCSNVILSPSISLFCIKSVT